MINGYFTLQHDNVNGGDPVQYMVPWSQTPSIDCIVAPRKISRNALGGVIMTASPLQHTMHSLRVRCSGQTYAYLRQFWIEGQVTFQHWDDSIAPYDVLLVQPQIQPIPKEPMNDILWADIDLISVDAVTA